MMALAFRKRVEDFKEIALPSCSGAARTVSLRRRVADGQRKRTAQNEKHTVPRVRLASEQTILIFGKSLDSFSNVGSYDRSSE
jgi:hypothetical protein